MAAPARRRRAEARRDGQPEHRALPQHALKLDLPPPNRGQIARQRQAQARSVDVPLQPRLDLAEFLENALVVVRERSRCRYRGPEKTISLPSGVVTRGDPHLALLGELERIGNQVAQDLRDLSLVGEELRQVLRRIEEKLDRRRYVAAVLARRAARRTAP